MDKQELPKELPRELTDEEEDRATIGVSPYDDAAYEANKKTILLNKANKIYQAALKQLEEAENQIVLLTKRLMDYERS